MTGNGIPFDVKLKINDEELLINGVSMGNPHAVLFGDFTMEKIANYGKLISEHPMFPAKTNVEFVEIISDNELKMKVWERGAGVTLACGTGACASLVAAHLNQKAGEQAVVHLDGGDLFIEWDQKTNHVYKTGPAHLVFTGMIEI